MRAMMDNKLGMFRGSVRGDEPLKGSSWGQVGDGGFEEDWYQ